MARGAESTQSVLDQMVAGATERKSKRAAGLTPVAGETAATHVLPRTEAAFPNDDPEEAVLQALLTIERSANQMLEAAAAVRAHLGKQSAAPVDEQAEQKERERAADAKHADNVIPLTPQAQELSDRIAKHKANAEAGKTDANVTETVTDGWVCPEHGSFKVATSRKGREYRVCAQECGEFEEL